MAFAVPTTPLRLGIVAFARAMGGHTLIVDAKGGSLTHSALPAATIIAAFLVLALRHAIDAGMVDAEVIIRASATIHGCVACIFHHSAFHLRLLASLDASAAVRLLASAGALGGTIAALQGRCTAIIQIFAFRASLFAGLRNAWCVVADIGYATSPTIAALLANAAVDLFTTTIVEQTAFGARALACQR